MSGLFVLSLSADEHNIGISVLDLHFPQVSVWNACLPPAMQLGTTVFRAEPDLGPGHALPLAVGKKSYFYILLRGWFYFIYLLTLQMLFMGGRVGETFALVSS